MFFIFFCLGSIMGSFLGVLAWRVPQHQSIVLPASHCTHCHKNLKPYDLIPILSALFLKGKCRYCQAPFGWSLTIVEFLCGLFTALLYYQFGWSWLFAFKVLLIWMGLALTLTDLFFLIVEPKIFYPFFLELLLLFFLHYKAPFSYLLETLFLACVLLTISYCLPQQLGNGDIILLCSWCLLLGLTTTFTIIFFASATAILFLLHQILRKQYQKTKPLPFVPFLTAGLVLTLFLF